MKTLAIGPNAITGQSSANLSDIFTAENCHVVFGADGNYKSWQPGRTINSIYTIEPNKGYIAIMKAVTDVSGYFIGTLNTLPFTLA